MRVLYVEDHLELRETLTLFLEDIGHKACAFETAEEALRADAVELFDVLVSDLSLPGMSGLDFAREVLSRDSQRRLVLCSGHELDELPHELGPYVRFLRKPFSLEELEDMLISLSGSLPAVEAKNNEHHSCKQSSTARPSK
jgi:two-component system cell cycle response regulator CpdR